jgi:hypothetical protein
MMLTPGDKGLPKNLLKLPAGAYLIEAAVYSRIGFIAMQAFAIPALLRPSFQGRDTYIRGTVPVCPTFPHNLLINVQGQEHRQRLIF